MKNFSIGRYTLNSIKNKTISAFITFIFAFLLSLITTDSYAQGKMGNRSLHDVMPAEFDKFGPISFDHESIDYHIVHLTCASNRDASSGSGQLGSNILYITQVADALQTPITSSQTFEINGYYDIRPISITEVGPNSVGVYEGDIIITVQAKKLGLGETRILFIRYVFPPSGFGLAGILLTPVEMNYNGPEDLYPMSTVLYADNLYTCGFAPITNSFGMPDLSSPKKAFIAKTSLDFPNFQCSIRFFDTPNLPSSLLDFDMFARLKILNHEIFAMGSQNKIINFTSSPNSTESYSLVSRIDPNSLKMLTTATMGDALTSGLDQSNVYGTFAMDMAISGPNQFTVLSNIYKHEHAPADGIYDSWCINNLDFNLNPPAINTATYMNESDGMRPYGLLNLSNGSLAVYGYFDNWQISSYVNTSLYPYFNVEGSPWTAIIPNSGPLTTINTTMLYTMFTLQSFNYGFWNQSLPEWSIPQFAINSKIFDKTSNPNIMPAIFMAGLQNLQTYTNTIGERFILADESGVSYCGNYPITFPTKTFTMTPATIAVTNNLTTSPVFYAFAFMHPQSYPWDNFCDNYTIGSFPGWFKSINPTTASLTKSEITINNIYPNPASDILHINATGLSNTDLVTVKIVDVLGKIVYTGTAVNEGTPTVHLPYIASGFYTATVSINNTNTQNFKLTIQ